MMRITQLPQLPDRPAEGHKGLFGKVLVVGGSETMLGAPVLAGTAALRMGSGLAYVSMPESMLPAALSVTPELIGVGRSARDVIDLAKKVDCVVVGPGLGQSPAAKKLLLTLLKLNTEILVDADGLNLLAAGKAFPKGVTKAILTPHPGEMKRLASLLGRSSVPDDDNGRLQLAGLAATTFGQIVVLKGHRTIVTDGRRAYINRTGDSSLSKGGTGDVLCGVIASLVGQRMDRFDAAVAGVWIHGKAGELAGQLHTPRAVLARDVITALPAAVLAYQRAAG
jgi:ADP-dependent NAD(P)H-hydrate dehydratase